MTLQALEDYCGKSNLGSVSFIEYLPTTGVDESAYEHVIGSAYNYIGTVPLVTGFSWLRAPLINQGSKLLSQQEQKTDHGTYYQVTIRGILPGHSAAMNQELDKMRRHRFLIRLKDSNGNKFLVGTLDQPLEFTHAHTSGDQKNRLNHQQVQWRGIQPIPLPGYTF